MRTRHGFDTGTSMTPPWTAPRWPSTIPTMSRSCFTATVIASDTHPATLRMIRSSRSLLRSRPSRSRLSPWTAWQMATSRQLTAARLHVTLAGPASTTRCPTRVTTFPSPRVAQRDAHRQQKWLWNVLCCIQRMCPRVAQRDVSKRTMDGKVTSLAILTTSFAYWSCGRSSALGDHL